MNIAAARQFVSAYIRARRFDRAQNRSRLDAWQQRWLAELLREVGQRSAFYRQYAGRPFTEWPIIDKQIWMDRFDDINTVGAKLKDVLDIASRAESTRDFAASWNGFTVGLSSGTSGSRGLFMASAGERAQWAGTLLAKLATANLLRREVIALVLRAGSTLYDSVQALRLRFVYVDQIMPWPSIVEALLRHNPTILAAPAQVLRLLADQDVALKPRRIISVAEVLDELDREAIERRYAVRVEQIYQATEGLLGTTCEHGLIHLNEPYVLIEPEWLDSDRRRMSPLVTDLRRRSQPVIRYRLNDVLRLADNPCRCGRASLALAGVDGRQDDVLWLEGTGARVPVFPDVLARTILRGSEALRDFEVQELAPCHWRLGLAPMPAAAGLLRVQNECAALARSLGGLPPRIEFGAVRPQSLTHKRRRIRGARSLPCTS